MSFVTTGTGGSGGGGGALQQDGSNSPTANISWDYNSLLDCGSLELQSGAAAVGVTLSAQQLGSGTEPSLDILYSNGVNYRIGSTFATSLTFKKIGAGAASFNLICGPDDGSETVTFAVGARSGAGGGALEYLNMGWRPTESAYSIDTTALAGGSSYPIRIVTTGGFLGAGTPNVTFETDGSTSVEGGDLKLSTGNAVQVDSQQVVAARQTGWADPTGTSDKTTFDTTTVTTQDLAEFVKALYEDLKAHGLIGN